MKVATAALALLFLLVYMLPLGLRPLIAPDEARYCEIPREMIHSGDWIVPHLNGLRYFEKPVLGYWAIAASMLAFGENAFAARLPSALATGISALLIALLLRKAGAGRTATLLAPAAFLTCLGIFATGAFNVLDSMFSMLLTAALVLCYGWHVQHDRRKQAILMAGVGVLCGLAFLVKGLVAFAVPAVVMLPFAIWEQRWKDMLKIAWLPILVAVLTSLPWCVAVAMREPDFIRHFFWVEHLQRYTGTSDRLHNHPIWFFLPLVLLGTLPWNMFAASTIAGFRKADLRQPFYRFLVCWFVFPFLFFSLSRGKLGTYILPCYPPLVILMIVGLVNYLESGRMRAFTLGRDYRRLPGRHGGCLRGRESDDPSIQIDLLCAERNLEMRSGDRRTGGMDPAAHRGVKGKRLSQEAVVVLRRAGACVDAGAFYLSGGAIRGARS